MTRRQLLADMDVEELREWAAYEQLEPFLRERLDVNLWKLELVLRTIYSDPKKGNKPKWDDVKVDWGADEGSGKQTPAQIRSLLRLQLQAAKGKAAHGTQHGHRQSERPSRRGDESVQQRPRLGQK